MSQPWIHLTPRLATNSRAYRALLDCARQLSRLKSPMIDDAEAVQDVRNRFLGYALETGSKNQVARVLVSALCDLRAQGWDIRVRSESISTRKPEADDDNVAEKHRIRLGLLVERDRQLREPTVRRFIHSMERRRLGPQGWTSIYSLMRDGVDLSARLQEIAHLPESARELELSTLIQPYLQVVDDSRCDHTGLSLKGIWRYFRHTWVTPHNTVPGRNIWFLVRDAAAVSHPVIGIAALGSAFVQMGVRDDWISWSTGRFLEELQRHPTDEWAEWLDSQLSHSIKSIYTADFQAQGCFTTRDLRKPTPQLIANLKLIANAARVKHRRYGSSSEHKNAPKTSIDWRARSTTSLFIWKRAETLASLLEARFDLQKSGFRKPTAQYLAFTLQTALGRRAITRVLRRVKGAHVGHDLLDVIVCGAVSPYRELLGGKLVAMLMASPEVNRAYVTRYGDTASVIASSMAGKAVKRVPRLVMLGTTSLYGVGSSQYNRLRMPADFFHRGAKGEIVFKELGVTEGYGSFHFSDATLQEMRVLVAQRDDGRPVRYIFGEGVNPRLREVRGALEMVGLPSDELLQHGSPRIVYGIALAHNAREVLLGRAHEPKYILPQDNPEAVTHDIARYWIERWVVSRVQRADVLSKIASHNLQYPIQHGARVALPPERAAGRLSLDL